MGFLEDIYPGTEGVSTGSARKAHILQMDSDKYLQTQNIGDNKKKIGELSELNRQAMITYRSNGSSPNK